jgi:hypothetical protein
MAGPGSCHQSHHWRRGLRRKTLCGFPAVLRCSRDRAVPVSSRADLLFLRGPFPVWCAPVDAALFEGESLSISPEALGWRGLTATDQRRRASIQGRRFAEYR